MKKRFYLGKEANYCSTCGTPMPEGQNQCPNPKCPSNTPPTIQ